MTLAMGQVKYRTKVVSVGPLAEEFRAAGILVLFGEGVPDELADVAVVHRPSTSVVDLAVGDVLVAGGEAMPILAVGEVVNENFRNLGHLSLKRNGQTVAALPGDLCATEGPIPPLAHGAEIVIHAATGVAGGKQTL